MSGILVQNPPQVVGQLPLQPKYLSAADNQNSRIQSVASQHLSPESILNTLLPFHNTITGRIQERTEDIGNRSKIIAKLRELKQELRFQTEIDLDQNQPLKDLLDLCKSYGLVVPEKQKLKKEEISSLIDNIEDCMNTHSDQSDSDRLIFRKLLNDSELIIQLITECMKSLHESRMTAVRNMSR